MKKSIKPTGMDPQTVRRIQNKKFRTTDEVDRAVKRLKAKSRELSEKLKVLDQIKRSRKSNKLLDHHFREFHVILKDKLELGARANMLKDAWIDDLPPEWKAFAKGESSSDFGPAVLRERELAVVRFGLLNRNLRGVAKELKLTISAIHKIKREALSKIERYPEAIWQLIPNLGEAEKMILIRSLSPRFQHRLLRAAPADVPSLFSDEFRVMVDWKHV